MNKHTNTKCTQTKPKCDSEKAIEVYRIIIMIIITVIIMRVVMMELIVIQFNSKFEQE
jgi:hypothetical protein